MRENYLYKYPRGDDKYVFVPTPECRRRGDYLNRFGSTIELPSYFFHYRKGGHVEALHRHLDNTYFFRVDLKNFFYSISRNRVSRVLRQYDFPENARTYAEWSTVRNPYQDGPRYVVPIGFSQSPLLASLVLYRSSVATCIEEALDRGVFVSVYFDDLVGSSRDLRQLEITYGGLLASCVQANFVANQTKLRSPAEDIVAFNCDLSHGYTAVTEERKRTFGAVQHTPNSISAFAEYCERVAEMNGPRPVSTR
jgi:hypothetical protein